jgi:hypothetical protein
MISDFQKLEQILFRIYLNKKLKKQEKLNGKTGLAEI